MIWPFLIRRSLSNIDAYVGKYVKYAKSATHAKYAQFEKKDAKQNVQEMHIMQNAKPDLLPLIPKQLYKTKPSKPKLSNPN